MMQFYLPFKRFYSRGGRNTSIVSIAQRLVSGIGTKAGAVIVGTVIVSTGWLVSYSIEKLISVPSMEYKIEHNPQGVSVQLTNLSRTYKFSSLEFVLHFNAPTTKKVKCKGFDEARSDIKSISPAYPPDDRPITVQYSTTYRVVGVHPGTTFVLTSGYECDYKPTFHIKSDSDTVRLIEAGPMTFIIRHEIGILLALLILWTLVAILAILGLPDDKDKE